MRNSKGKVQAETRLRYPCQCKDAPQSLSLSNMKVPLNKPSSEQQKEPIMNLLFHNSVKDKEATWKMHAFCFLLIQFFNHKRVRNDLHLVVGRQTQIQSERKYEIFSGY